MLQTNSVGPEPTFYPTSSIETGFHKHSVDVPLTSPSSVLTRSVPEARL